VLAIGPPTVTSGLSSAKLCPLAQSSSYATEDSDNIFVSVGHLVWTYCSWPKDSFGLPTPSLGILLAVNREHLCLLFRTLAFATSNTIPMAGKFMWR